MSRKREHINMTTRLAVALSELACLRSQVYGTPCMSFEEMKATSAKGFTALYELDHASLHANCGGGHFTNLTFRLKAEHKAKTRKDVKEYYRGLRLAKAQAAHREVLARKGLKPLQIDVRGDRADTPAPRKRAWPKRKMQSRQWPTRERRT